jgi:ABC transporter DrrB family efflux protein
MSATRGLGSATLLAGLSDTLVVTSRNLRRIRRTPRLLATSSVQPVLVVASGMIDRFRTLPISRAAVLTGRCLADIARSMLVVGLVLAAGVLIGFRFRGGVLPAVAALGLTLAFGFAFMWLFALVGLVVGDPETAQLAAFLPLIPFLFASSVFVPLASMPAWLQAFARVQPVSVTVNAVRALSEGGAVTHWALQSGAWIAGFIVVFGGLAVTRYRSL